MAARKSPARKAVSPSKRPSAPPPAVVSTPGPHPPLPPSDLLTRTLDVEEIEPRELVRISWPGKALFWSPDRGSATRARFDAPGGEFQVHYSAYDFAGAFVEALLRQDQLPYLTWSDIVAREVSILTVTRPIRLMPMYGRQLAQMKATAAVASGPYTASRQWSLALSQWANSDGPLDGILYPSRHDDTMFCVALFDRAASAIQVLSSENLGTRESEILGLQRRYRFPLDLSA